MNLNEFLSQNWSLCGKLLRPLFGSSVSFGPATDLSHADCLCGGAGCVSPAL